MTEDRRARASDALLALLREHPQGLSEYELLCALDERAQPGFERPDFHDSLGLFQTHFLLFHTLYSLRDQLRGEQRAELEISPLKIRLHPYAAAGSETLAECDPLRDYYLDLDNLDATSRRDVDSMLGRFWARLHSGDERQQALEVLGLSDPVDYDTVKRRYRRLVMEHHPDRGGDKQRLQELNTAMAILERNYVRQL